MQVGPRPAERSIDTVPCSEIIADGDRDEQTDTWNPVYDENGVNLKMEPDGKTVKMPGSIIPLASSAEGVNGFMLVPYAGVCIHVPPPLPNQLVFVTTETPRPNARLRDAVWVIENMAARPQSTGIGDSGYEIVANKIEAYQRPNN
ncbi:DUF3299 domain-containing protein [Sulfitobacter aestuarii]|uniref:DUF3299 domain-containing protein n=1 Tax=Sulfitobacter aestuarii TaxID=2161676 RepID=A0ABW5U5E9_9RHOB